MNFERMVSTVQEWINQDPEFKKEFMNCSYDDLILYHHHPLGTRIRNEFKLWETEWEPKLIDGIDCAEDHPDAISMRIVEEVWNVQQ